MRNRTTLKCVAAFMLVAFIARADEGMWMPQLVEALNYKDMRKNGFRLSAKDIYSINRASMKDAVAIFGGGCTAEMISSKGLLLTNHHCGFSSIAALSTVQKDYLKNGFFAMNQNEEMWCKGLTVTFIKRIEDVTQKVLANMPGQLSDAQKDSVVQGRMKAIEKDARGNTHYDAFVRPFYYGNEYYLFVTEVFRDVRLVGTPPESLGKFGGETDNWVWPRHNADFSMFRIYAGADNKPAEFSADNVPYKPAYSFPINIGGEKEGDFTMVYGFPGRTQEYLTSFAVKLLMDQQDPLRVRLRGKRLQILEAEMKRNDTLRLMYTTRYAGIANAYKKWSGEVQGLQRTNAIGKKQAFEQRFLASVTDPSKKQQYTNILQQLKKTYEDYAPLSRQYDYFAECLWGVDGFRMAASLSPVFAELKKKQAGHDNRFAAVLKESTPALPFKNYNQATDRKLCKAMLQVYLDEVDRSLMPDYLDSLYTAYDNNVERLTDDLYNKSRMTDNTRAKSFFENFEANAAANERDPLYMLASAIYQHYQKTIIPQAGYFERQIVELQKEYMAALIESLKGKKFYPDANGTLRVAYGKVEGYEGRDGIIYKSYTTLDGLVEKNRTGIEDYEAPARVLELYEKKDFGQYSDRQGRLRTAFVASNHTTGGNSGSPVINGKGELIGTNFDRNWEGTMSDVMYDVSFCRNIVLDVRFTLWVVDRFAGAGYLLQEMKIVR